MIPSATMTAMLMTLRKNMTTPFVDLRVTCIQSLYRGHFDTSAPSLCRVELIETIEYRTACVNWTSLLTNTLQPIGTLSPATMTKCTSDISAVTGHTPAVVPGSLDRFFEQERDEGDFVEFLKGSTSAQPITETSLDTYLRAADASTELVASTKMLDYVIDINIYQFLRIN